MNRSFFLLMGIRNLELRCLCEIRAPHCLEPIDSRKVLSGNLESQFSKSVHWKWTINKKVITN